MAVFLLGMFVPRANAPGVLIGLQCGVVSLVVVISRTDIPSWWYGGFVIVPTLVFGFLASFCFPPPAAKALTGSVWSVRGSREKGES